VLNRFIIDGYVDSYHYDSEKVVKTLESDRHCNFVSFKEDIFSEPFQGVDGVFNCNYTAAKYSSSNDQTKPYIYGNDNFHFHRWINSVWQISPVPLDADYKQYLNNINASQEEFRSLQLAKKLKDTAVRRKEEICKSTTSVIETNKGRKTLNSSKTLALSNTCSSRSSSNGGIMRVYLHQYTGHVSIFLDSVSICDCQFINMILYLLHLIL
jgi:hypothetical protein